MRGTGSDTQLGAEEMSDCVLDTGENELSEKKYELKDPNRIGST